jgi:hypothetical protein
MTESVVQRLQMMAAGAGKWMKLFDRVVDSGVGPSFVSALAA